MLLGLMVFTLLAFILEYLDNTIKSAEDVQEYLARQRPDYCILFPSWFPRMTRQPWLSRVHEIDVENSTGGGNELVVYRVTGTPAPIR